jgi:peptidoglycan/xylan/chitin deacetylase (PgdA/CDA1 family)
MRLDRLITLSLMQPLRRITHHASRITSVPILMYHSISDDPEPGVSPYYQVNTRPAVFRQHMQFLADHGYQTISLPDLVTLMAEQQSNKETKSDSSPSSLLSAFVVNQRSVVLTFDDGFRDFYTDAFPVLQQHAFTATVFLPTAFIGDERRQFRPSTINSQLSTTKDCLTWSEARELRKNGIHFGSHTVNHPKLVELDWPEIKSELSYSKSEIEQQLGEPATSFCYPFAFPQTDRSFAQRFRDLLCETGYSSCATTELGRVQPGTDPFRLKRLPANSLDDLALFAAKLEGAYDWLAAPQSAVKTMKAFLRPRSSGKNPVPEAGAPPTPARMLNSAEH